MSVRHIRRADALYQRTLQEIATSPAEQMLGSVNSYVSPVLRSGNGLGHTSYCWASASMPNALLISAMAFTPMIPLIARFVIFAFVSPSAVALEPNA